jgi:hypothetical protein
MNKIMGLGNTAWRNGLPVISSKLFMYIGLVEMKAVIATKPTATQVTALFKIKNWQDSNMHSLTELQSS